MLKPQLRAPGSTRPRGSILRTLKTGLLLLSLGVTAGCTQLVQELSPPSVAVAGLELVNAGVTNQTFRITLDVGNPNAIPLPIRGLSYDLALAGGPFAKGEAAESFRLPANGSERVRLNVTTDLVGALSRITQVLQGSASTVDYDISGALQVDLPLVEPLPFSQQGQVPLAIR